MSGNMFIGGMCDNCGCPKHFGTCKATAKETRSGSPLESVVQGRPESPGPLSHDRSGDADLDEIEKALNEKIERMERETADMALDSEYEQASRIASEASGVSKAWFIVKRIIERQHSTRHEVE